MFSGGGVLLAKECESKLNEPEMVELPKVQLPKSYKTNKTGENRSRGRWADVPGVTPNWARLDVER